MKFVHIKPQVYPNNIALKFENSSTCKGEALVQYISICFVAFIYQPLLHNSIKETQESQQKSHHSSGPVKVTCLSSWNSIKSIHLRLRLKLNVKEDLLTKLSEFTSMLSSSDFTNGILSHNLTMK